MSTPMMKQYFEQKEQYKDTLLFFRMGDFFELFYDDAVTASKVLDIALTKRGKAEDATPMCGVPAHAYEAYLLKLIKAGFKVAICDQLESPEEAKKRGGYKEIVRREVIRVVTPGTITEETLLEGARPNYLLAVAAEGSDLAISWVDITTSEFFTAQITEDMLASELARINPSEILLPTSMLVRENLFETFGEWKKKLSPQPDNMFDHKRSENKLKSFYKIISLDAFGALSRQQISASGVLLEYLALTQIDALPALPFPKNFAGSNFMQIDAGARSSLELVSGEANLFRTINRTQTACGARLLYSILSSPLRYQEGINQRLDTAEYFIENENLRSDIRGYLRQVPDLERSAARLAVGRGLLRDMLAIRTSLVLATEIKEQLIGRDLPPLLRENITNIKPLSTLLAKLTDAFKDEVGVHLRDGGFIREGYSAELDTLLNIRDHSRGLIEELRAKYAAESGIPNLKISYNNILGYYIETNAQNAKKLGDGFLHRQTMANAMRFTTADLSNLQTKTLNAAEEALTLELQIFNEVSAEIRESMEQLTATANSLAFVDVSSSFAELAVENNYTRPQIDESEAFTITGGRHPVVELTTKFIANDCNLTDKNLWLLTGPNMAGKSTFLRQNALIAIMAQIGSFVPAKHAHIGCVDKVFSRVGASDNLARGQSTFMVEMTETAAILNLATSRSLVILDEIGRGTATYDGLSIAWAVLEYIHNHTKCRTIFATHYHELCALELPRIALYSMKVKEWKEQIIFLHEIGKGAADRSYGIHVAELAGLPKQVTQRATSILKDLEGKSEKAKPVAALPLFSQAEPAQERKTSKVEEMLKAIDPNNLSPKEALDLVYKLSYTII